MIEFSDTLEEFLLSGNFWTSLFPRVVNRKDGSVIKTIPAKSIVAEMEDLEFIIIHPKIKKYN